MSIAALIVWILTAAGGSVLLATWIAKGGVRSPRTSHFPPAVVFGHFALAAIGLVVWIVYVIAGQAVLAWIAFGLLAVVALLGFTMFARWIPTYRARAQARADSSGGGPGTTSSSDRAPAEQHFRVVVVGGHGVLAVATVVLVLLTALGIGGN